MQTVNLWKGIDFSILYDYLPPDIVEVIGIVIILLIALAIKRAVFN